MPESEDSTNGLYRHTTEFDFENQQQPRSDVVVINDVTLRPIEIAQERVVTFSMIDRVHQRPDGTAGRNFRENRHRLIPGKHFREVTQADEIRRLGVTRPQGGLPGKVIVLSERGYLMLVKSFTDDLAWQVQDALVESYFVKPEPSFRPRQAAKLDVNREQRLTLQHHVRIARMAGLSGNQALLAANSVTAAMTGIDTLGMMGLSHLTAPRNEQLLSPTDIGRQMRPARSPQAVNQMLCGMGLQHAIRTAKGKIDYDLTEEGEQAGGVMQDTGKRHSTGAPVRQVRWGTGIVRTLQNSEH